MVFQPTLDGADLDMPVRVVSRKTARTIICAVTPFTRKGMRKVK